MYKLLLPSNCVPLLFPFTNEGVDFGYPVPVSPNVFWVWGKKSPVFLAYRSLDQKYHLGIWCENYHEVFNIEPDAIFI